MVHSYRQGGGGSICPLLCCQGPQEGASPRLQVDGCDICGSAGLAGPLATGAPGGFGRRAGRGLGGFSEALPERSFNLLLTGPQAVHLSACDPCQQLRQLIPRCGTSTQALHCSPNAACGDHGWRVHGKGVICGTEGQKGLGMFFDQGLSVLGQREPVQNQSQEIMGNHSCQVPLELPQDQHLPVPQLAGRDRVVGVDAQFFDGQGRSLAQLGGQQHADRTQELQLRLSGGDAGQVAIQVVHGQGEDFLLAALLLTDLQHPVRQHLPHVRLDLPLHTLEVGGAGHVTLLQAEQALQDTLVPEQPRVRPGPGRVPGALAAQQLHDRAARGRAPSPK